MGVWEQVGKFCALLAASIGVGYLAGTLVSFVLMVSFRRWHSCLSKSSVKELQWSVGIVAGSIFWWTFSDLLTWTSAPRLILTAFIKFFWIMGGAWLLAAIFDIAMDSIGARATTIIQRADHILIPIARKFGKFILVVGALLVFMASMNVNVVSLIAGLGVGGLVVALAAKDSLENIFGSLTILFDMPFGINDWIKMGDVEGVVEELNLRSTRLRTFQDTVITLPNANLIKASVENFGSRRYRRLNLTLPIRYDSDLRAIDRFCEDVRALLQKNARVKQDNAFVRLYSVSDSSIGILIQCYFLTTDYGEELEMREEVLQQILKEAVAQKLNLGPAPAGPVQIVGSTIKGQR